MDQMFRSCEWAQGAPGKPSTVIFLSSDVISYAFLGRQSAKWKVIDDLHSRDFNVLLFRYPVLGGLPTIARTFKPQSPTGLEGPCQNPV